MESPQGVYWHSAFHTTQAVALFRGRRACSFMRISQLFGNVEVAKTVVRCRAADADRCLTLKRTGHTSPGFTSRKVAWLVLFTVLCSAPGTLVAQGELGQQPRLFFPSPLQERSWIVSLGFTLTTPPRDLTEELAVRAPAFDAHALYGLPENFYLDGRVISQFVQNHFSLGAKWAYGNDRWSFALGYDVAWWFGFLTVGGFDSKARGWENYPNLTVGYALDDVLLSLKGELILITSYSSYNGENEVSSDQGKFSGAAISFVIEQPAWKNTHVTLGFRAIYAKFYWMTWALFSTFDRYLFYPELTFGFIL